MGAHDGTYIAARRRLARAAELAGRGRGREAAQQLDQAAHSLACLAEQYRLADALRRPGTTTNASPAGSREESVS